MGTLPDAVIKIIDAGVGYVWLLLLAIWGGTASYIMRLKQGKIERFSFMELIGEWTISGFAGLLTAYACSEFGASWNTTVICAGVAGHMGGKTIHFFEQSFKKRFS